MGNYNNRNRNSNYRGRNQGQRGPHKEGPSWEVIDTKVRNNAAVQISELPLQVPRYSFRVGTAAFDERTGDISLKPFLTGFNVLDAAELLKEVGEKYNKMRSDAMDRVNKIRENWESKSEDDV